MATTKKKATGILMKRSTGDYIFDTINVIIMLLLCLVTLYPMYFVICASFTKNTYLVAHPGAVFYPVGFTVGSYKLAFSHPLLLSGYKNILIVLAVSLPINIALTLFCGYFLASKNVLLKKPVLFIIMFTMFFSGGMIPGWLNIRSLGLYNSLWALILPGAMSVYNSIICRTAIEAVPDSLQESAYIDGANDLVIVFRIILPLIMPTIAVLLLYYGVGHWNAWFNASIVTSGFGLFAATFGVAVYSNIDIVSSMCMLMARGALVSVVSVVFILPAMLMLLDAVVRHTILGMKKKTTGGIE